MIDNKARLVSDLMCDGLGACLGECPQGAITIEKREAEPYNEVVAMKEIVRHGQNTVIAHLKHLLDHNETRYFEEAVTFLESLPDPGFDVDEMLDEVYQSQFKTTACGCPGSAMKDFRIDVDKVEEAGKAGVVAAATVEVRSELRQWPVQMHLINPVAPYFRGADVVLAADCVAFSLGNFHQKYLKDHSLAIACPKLDHGKEVYLEKLKAMIDDAKINTLTVMIMEVPCCGGLVQMAEMARSQASRKVPLKMLMVGIQGDILNEQWL
jgi:ferredoxin